MTAILLVLTLIVSFFIFKKAYPKVKDDMNTKSLDYWAESKQFWKALLIPAVLIAFCIINPFRLERIDAGCVGVKFKLVGNDRGISRYEYKSGWVIYNKWTAKIYEFPTYQQHIEYPEQEVITKGGFATTIKPSFNYSIKPGNVGDMFQELRKGIKDVEKEWLHTSIIGSINNVTNKWTVDSIFNHRENFESEIVAEVNRHTVKWFLMSQIRTNITPPKELRDAIVQKTNALQEVQVAENKKLAAEADMLRKIAQAKGDSADLVIHAAGEAEAIFRRQSSLTPQYIEYMKIEKWSTTDFSGNTRWNIT